MTQRESKLSARIAKELRANGVFCFKVHGSALMMAGLPDLICCVDGFFLGLEVKHEETRDNVSERQKYVHGLIKQAGGQVFVVCSAAEALQRVQRLRAKANPK